MAICGKAHSSDLIILSSAPNLLTSSRTSSTVPTYSTLQCPSQSEKVLRLVPCSCTPTEKGPVKEVEDGKFHVIDAEMMPYFFTLLWFVGILAKQKVFRNYWMM